MYITSQQQVFGYSYLLDFNYILATFYSKLKTSLIYLAIQEKASYTYIPVLAEVSKNLIP